MDNGRNNDWGRRIRDSDYSDYSFGSELAVRERKERAVPPADPEPPSHSTISVNFRSLDSEHRSIDRSLLSHGGATSSSRGGGQSLLRDLSFADGTFESTVSRSRLSAFTVYESTLPMAFDNDRFFDFENGYQLLLSQALEEIANVARDNHAWSAPQSEVTFLGRIWRWILRLLLHWTCDTVNRLRLTRGLVDYLNFLTVYESFTLQGLIRCLDNPRPQSDLLHWQLSLSNRNVSRIFLHTVISRWDWFFHTGSAIQHRRLFDLLGWLPWIGRYADPPSENHPSSRWYAVWNLWDSFLELFRWHNDDAHNLTPEATGFEQAVCDHFGTHFGRIEFNKFRTEHRLTIDESIVRSFVTSPSLTLRNNGVEHVLRCVSKHWREMLSSEYGNFAHQRMELLNPFEALRFHLPATLHVLANLRGRSAWDSEVLAPLVARLQLIDPAAVRLHSEVDVEVQTEKQIIAPCQAGKSLAQQVKDTVVENVCGGIQTRMEPLNNWLKAIIESFDDLQSEAEAVASFVESVQMGTLLGYQLLKIVNWRIPSEHRLQRAITKRILRHQDEDTDVPHDIIDRALEKLSPKDERTLRECIQKKAPNMYVAKLLIQQATRLLEREVQRDTLDKSIRLLSRGRSVELDDLETTKWYWVDVGSGYHVCMLSRKLRRRLKFVRIDTNTNVLYERDLLRCREYVPIAEAISRAQKAYMSIEIDHCKRFSYSAFMEFGSGLSPKSLRSHLRRLVTVSQIFCQELDTARLNTLTEIRTSISKRRVALFATPCKPQNVVVIGGGPTGLLCAIHCLQNTLLSGGTLKLYEGRGGNSDHNGSSFERAQIVRLDARQIAMLRYHLGVGFEDVFIPLKGETEAHTGNAIPSQQFVEVTIKRLEAMLLDEVVKLRSSGLLEFFSDSMIQYDDATGDFKKDGSSLKVGDRFHMPGYDMSMLVREFYFQSSLDASNLVEGVAYDIVLPQESKARRFNLKNCDVEDDWYHFVEEGEGGNDGETTLSGNFEDLPPIYHVGEARAGPSSVLVKNTDSTFDVIDYMRVEGQSIKLDFSGSHVVIALGKSSESTSHFKLVTEEPYGVCCVEGTKISAFMHHFGVPRFRFPIVDDYLTRHLHNTRVLGDFRKSVATFPVMKLMKHKLEHEEPWKLSVKNLEGPDEALRDALLRFVLQEVSALNEVQFRRERLQCRLFELGNNYYLGMELPREFDMWKQTARSNAFPIDRKAQQQFTRIMDRLWFESVIEVIGTSHAIHRRERRAIPKIYTTSCPYEEDLKGLGMFEAFRFANRDCKVLGVNDDGISVAVGPKYSIEVSLPPQTVCVDIADQKRKTLSQFVTGSTVDVVDSFEIVQRGPTTVVARSSGGYLVRFPSPFGVHRCSDLSRSPDGYSESKVALASFPVAHVVANRTLRTVGNLRPDNELFVTAYIGDAQASPHFMRYSGLTGACINCASFNSLLGQAVSGTGGIERAQRYAFETHWSNSEVVRRGTGLCYGFDAFLRPGFTYSDLVDHLYELAQEHSSLRSTRPLLSRDWKIKVAASLVPRGIEYENSFYETLLSSLMSALQSKFEQVMRNRLRVPQLSQPLKHAVSHATKSLTRSWRESPTDEDNANIERFLRIDERDFLADSSAELATVADALISSVHCACEMKLLNLRFDSELFNQPEAIDSFAEFLLSSQVRLFESRFFTAIVFVSVALTHHSSGRSSVWVSFLFLILSGASALVAVADVVRTRDVVRNKLSEFTTKTTKVCKALYALLTTSDREELGPGMNPFLLQVERLVLTFEKSCDYYGEQHGYIVGTSLRRFKESQEGANDLIDFMEEIATVFIPVTFHTNSYIQDDLVRIYGALDEYLRFIQQEPVYAKERNLRNQRAMKTFSSLMSLDKAVSEPRRRVPKNRLIHMVAVNALGMLKAHSVGSQNCFVLQDLISFCTVFRLVRMRNIFVLTGGILILANLLFGLRLLMGDDGVLDSDGVLAPVLYHAGWLYVIAGVGTLWSVAYLGRKLLSLVTLEDSLSVSDSPDVRHLLQLIRFESIIALVRILSVLATIVVLFSWILDELLGSAMLGVFSTEWLLLLSVVAMGILVITRLLQLYSEFFLRYKLVNLGPTVSTAMKRQVLESRRKFPEPTGIHMATQSQLQLFARSYAARDFLVTHRFDAILDPDRYSSILHHLESAS